MCPGSSARRHPGWRDWRVAGGIGGRSARKPARDSAQPRSDRW